MNGSERARLQAIIKNLESKDNGKKHVFGAYMFTPKELIKQLKTNPQIRKLYFDMLDNLVIAELNRDASHSS